MMPRMAGSSLAAMTFQPSFVRSGVNKWLVKANWASPRIVSSVVSGAVLPILSRSSTPLLREA